MKIGEWEYDITKFKHPGGSVINYMLANIGADATEAFREFHSRSRTAEAWLRALPKRPATLDVATLYDAKERAMLADFARFRLQLEQEGEPRRSRPVPPRGPALTTPRSPPSDRTQASSTRPRPTSRSGWRSSRPSSPWASGC